MLGAFLLLVSMILAARVTPTTGYKKFPAGIEKNGQIHLQIHLTRLLDNMPQSPDVVGRIPQLGYDVSGLGARTYELVRNATEFGYRHFDTTEGETKYTAFGRAIRNSGIPRKDFFITAKIRYSEYGSERARRAIDRLVLELGVGQIDLLLMGSPAVKYEEEDEERSMGGSFTIGTNGDDEVKGIKDLSTSIRLRLETWRAMEEAINHKRVKFIGVRNFDEDHLWELLQYARIKPAVNQVEIHPYLPKPKLIEYCSVHKILIASYAPSIQDKHKNLMHEPLVAEVAKDLSISQEQVLLKWAVDQDIVIIYKSKDAEEMAEVMKVFNIKYKVRPKDMKKLAKLDCGENEDDNESCFDTRCAPECLPGQYYFGTHQVQFSKTTSEIRLAQDKELELRLRKKFKPKPKEPKAEL